MDLLHSRMKLKKVQKYGTKQSHENPKKKALRAVITLEQSEEQIDLYEESQGGLTIQEKLSQFQKHKATLKKWQQLIGIGYVLQFVICAIFVVISLVQIILMSTPLFIILVDVSDSIPVKHPLEEDQLVMHASIINSSLLLVSFLGFVQAILAYRYQRYVRSNQYKNLQKF